MSTENIKIGIVEDEVLIGESLERNLVKHGYTVLPQAMDFEEAMEMLQNDKPDLIILDINLESDKNGIEVAHEINTKHHIPFIFLTSHLDASTLSAAKETRPAGYLTKPFHFESLYTSIEVALHNYSQRQKPNDLKIPLKSGTVTELVDVSDILYMKSDHVYVEVMLKNKSILVRNSLKNLLAELPEDHFFQVHRSYAVNLQHVVSFGAGILFLSGIEIPVSRSFQTDLLRRLK
ncbi:MAG: response regulator [Flavobacteriales bacterium]|jgi:DNA-binding LytR/AlgR family response regulator|nr:response regulator [Flavobacteriales bacterium]